MRSRLPLGLLHALGDRSHPVRAAKSGPDHIAPRLHEAACDRPCLNLDAWAMSPAGQRPPPQIWPNLRLPAGTAARAGS